MVKTLSQQEKDTILKEVELEFPHDPALQQVHAAQLIVARLAELEGIYVYEYIRRQSLYKSNEL